MWTVHRPLEIPGSETAALVWSSVTWACACGPGLHVKHPHFITDALLTWNTLSSQTPLRTLLWHHTHTHTHQALTVGFCSLEMIQHNRFRLYHIIFILCPFYHINLFIGIFVLCLHNQSTTPSVCVCGIFHLFSGTAGEDYASDHLVKEQHISAQQDMIRDAHRISIRISIFHPSLWNLNVPSCLVAMEIFLVGTDLLVDALVKK